MAFFAMVSCLIFKCNVDGGIPSFAAAPFGPAILPLRDEVVHRYVDLCVHVVFSFSISIWLNEHRSR